MSSEEKKTYNYSFLPFYIILFNIILAALTISGAVFYVVYIKDGDSRNSRVLQIKDSNSGRIYGRWSLEEGDEFSIGFIHSVNQSPVRETFIIENGMIRLQALRFYSYGAGIPSDLDEGQMLGRDGDAMIITGFNTVLNELNLIVGTIADHLLLINGEELSLQELTGLNPGKKNAQITISLR